MQAKHGAAAPGYPLFPSFQRASSPHTIAAARSLGPLAPPPTDVSQFLLPSNNPFFPPFLPFLSFLSFFIPPAPFEGVTFLFSGVPLPSARSRLLSMLECSTLQYITYTLLPGSPFFLVFPRPPLSIRRHRCPRAPAAFRSPGPPSRSLNQYRFLFVSSLPSFFRGGVEPRCIRAAFIPSPLETRKREHKHPRRIPSRYPDFWHAADPLSKHFQRRIIRLTIPLDGNKEERGTSEH